MAEKTTKQTGNSNTASTWTPEAVVAEGDICTVKSPNKLTWNSTVKAQSLTVASGAGLKETVSLKIGTGSLPGSNVLLSAAAGTLEETGNELIFSPTAAGVGTIAIAGQTWNTKVLFTSGKCQLLENAKFGLSVVIPCKLEGSAELDLNGHTLEVGLLEAVSTSTLKGASSTIKCVSGTAGSGLNAASTTTITGSPNVEYTATGAPNERKLFAGGNHTFGTVTFVSFSRIEGSNTFTSLVLNNKTKPTSCKGTLTALSNHLVVTEGEANLFAEVEVTGTGIPASTTIIKKIEAKVWEMSANATETVVVAETITIYNPGVSVIEGTTQTVTTFSSNGTEAEPARLYSSVAGKSWTLKLPTGNSESTAFLRVKDLAVSGGDLYLPNGINLGGNNEHVHFEAAPAGKVQKIEASSSFVGISSRNIAHEFSPKLSFLGVLPRQIFHAATAKLSFTGNPERKITSALTAISSFAGNSNRKVVHGFSATLSWMGNLPRNAIYRVIGTLPFSGNVSHNINRAQTASLSLAGSLSSNVGYKITAGLSLAGHLTQNTLHGFTTGISFVGSLSRKSILIFAAKLSSTGTLTHNVSHIISATLIFAGNLLHSTRYRLTGALSFAGNVRRSIAYRLTAVVSSAGALSRNIAHPLNGGLFSVGSVVPVFTSLTVQILTANLRFKGLLRNNTIRQLLGTVSLSGTLPRFINHPFSSTLRFVGRINARKVVVVPLSKLIHFFTGFDQSTTKFVSPTLIVGSRFELDELIHQELPSSITKAARGIFEDELSSPHTQIQGEEGTQTPNIESELVGTKITLTEMVNELILKKP